MGAFARALRTGEGPALAFLPAPPTDDEGWAAWLAKTAAAVGPVPPAFAEALAGRQVALEAGPAAEANARALADPDRPALAVVTGQQPGLLGGPLLTFHKAAGAIALARALDGLGGHRVVPVFWLASEDHDLDEANRAVVIDRAGQARGLRLELEGDGRSLMDVAVPDEVAAEFAGALAAALPDTERSRAVQALVAHRSGEDLATWSARCLAALLGDSGLVILEPPVLQPWVGGTYAWLLDHAETIRDAVRATGEALEAADLPAPLHPLAPDATPLFVRAEAGGPRLRVGLSGDAVTLRDEPSPLDRDALRAHLLAHPELGSGNVVGRVLVQNRHLPTLAYIAGPSEIAYQAQVRAAAEATGVFFPLALPRPHATWVDAKTDESLAAFGLDARAFVRGATPPDETLDDELTDELEAVTARIARLEEDAAALLARGGRGADAVRRGLDRAAQAWAKAEASIRRGFEVDAGVGRARWARACALLHPHDKPQDRLLSPVSLAARHGIEVLREGLAALEPLHPTHHLVHLGVDDRTEEPQA